MPQCCSLMPIWHTPEIHLINTQTCQFYEISEIDDSLKHSGHHTITPIVRIFTKHVLSRYRPKPLAKMHTKDLSPPPLAISEPSLFTAHVCKEIFNTLWCQRIQNMSKTKTQEWRKYLRLLIYSFQKKKYDISVNTHFFQWILGHMHGTKGRILQ